MVVVATSMPFLLAGVLSLLIARISGCRSTLKLQFDIFCRVYDNRCVAGVIYVVISNPSHTHFDKLVSFR